MVSAVQAIASTSSGRLYTHTITLKLHLPLTHLKDIATASAETYSLRRAAAHIASHHGRHISHPICTLFLGCSWEGDPRMRPVTFAGIVCPIRRVIGYGLRNLKLVTRNSPGTIHASIGTFHISPDFSSPSFTHGGRMTMRNAWHPSLELHSLVPDNAKEAEAFSPVQVGEPERNNFCFPALVTSFTPPYTTSRRSLVTRLPILFLSPRHLSHHVAYPSPSDPVRSVSSIDRSTYQDAYIHLCTLSSIPVTSTSPRIHSTV